MREPGVTSDAATQPPLPGALRALLAREGLRATAVREVTSLRRGDGARRTFRIELADGGCLKGRIHRSADVPPRMARWIPLASSCGLAALRAAGGEATLEEWVEGAPLAPQDEPAAEQAGALLGAIHASLPPERLGAGDARLASWCEESQRRFEEVRAAGQLRAAWERVLSEQLQRRPCAARWGLYHGDFSPENLVVAGSAVRCVDNTTVRPDLVEYDLAFTANRWPLDGAVRERFLRGYRSHADPSAFLESERFWRISAALRSAAYRIREGTDPALPLDEIARLVG